MCRDCSNAGLSHACTHTHSIILTGAFVWLVVLHPQKSPWFERQSLSWTIQQNHADTSGVLDCEDPVGVIPPDTDE